MIELQHIEKSFGDNHVLKDVSVAFAEGSVTALVGPSGGGKSTLLRCINLLEIPTSGRVAIGDEAIDFRPGVKVGWASIQKLRRQTGMVFQNFQLFPHRTAIENVSEGLTTVLKWPKERARARVVGWCARRFLSPLRGEGGCLASTGCAVPRCGGAAAVGMCWGRLHAACFTQSR